MSVVEWANQNSGFATVVLTLVYVIATVVIVLVGMRANSLAHAGQELQERLEAQRNRPFVIVLFEMAWDEQDQAHTYVVVKNTGLTMAEDIVINIDPIPFFTPVIGGKKVTKVPFMLNHTIPTLAPGQEVSDTAGYTANLFAVLEEPVFKGSVAYRAQTGEHLEERFVIDWKSMKDAIPLRRSERKA